MRRLIYGAFLMVNIWSGLSWISSGKSAYEIGNYLLTFGGAQLVMTFVSVVRPQKWLVALLTVMQLLPLVLYSLAGGGIYGGLNCVTSLLCLILGVVSLVFKEKPDCAK